MTTFGKSNRICRKHSGEYFTNEDGEIGEAVHWWGWGGVDLLFSNGNIVTYAMGDILSAPANMLVTASMKSVCDAITAWTFDEFGGAVKKGEADAPNS